MKSSLLGILALLIGVVALGFAALPRIAIESPRHLTSTAELPRPIGSAPTLPNEPEAHGSLTLEMGKFSVTIGDQKPETSAAEQQRQQALAYQNAAIDRQLARREATIRQFTFAAICCSLLGLVLGPIAWVREKQPFLSGTAMSICCLALFWEYIVIGVATAVGIVLVIMLLSALAS